LFAFDYSNHWLLRQDGVTIHDWGQGSSSTIWTEQGLVTGWSGSHEYDFCAINAQNNGLHYASLARIRVTGTLGSQPTSKPIIAAVGDSITADAEGAGYAHRLLTPPISPGYMGLNGTSGFRVAHVLRILYLFRRK
jgi:hypothetical protein